MQTLFLVLLCSVIIGICALYGHSFLTFAIVMAGTLVMAGSFELSFAWVRLLIWLCLIASVLIVYVHDVRLQVLTRPLYRIFKRSMPRISTTEEEALNAGEPWWETDIFQGRPNWEKLESIELSQLSIEEQSFLENETETLCKMIDDWQIVNHDRDLPEEVWAYIKQNGFFSMVIDVEYGGKGFSAAAHSAVVMKIASRSLTAAVTVMVPNSLGPGELLHHYGTDEQKSHYLPRLASGEEIPCFALTGPWAGSDAVAMPDNGVVCKGKHDGKEVIGLKLNFDKRYITLAPVATLVALAFKCYDPDSLLGGEKDLGITCCLMPASHKGVNIGDRHIPLDMAFMNGTIRGEDVFVPLDWVIGGQEMIGQGWKMLVECLSIGRAISLPAVSCANAMMCHLMSGAYSRIRQQFKMPIGKFEGLEAALGRIGGINYMMEATRLLTLTAVDKDVRPSVASAIAKYHMTEFGRRVINDAMDIHGGKGIIMGPNNYLGRAYQGLPISITVEGANILTRNLIIFGQGAMCAHPYIKDAFYAMMEDSEEEGVNKLDAALVGHLRYNLRSKIRAIWTSWSAGYWVSVPSRLFSRQYQYVSRLSAAYAWLADVSLVYLGGALKRKERLSAKLGDVMSHLYMASAVLKYFASRGEPEDEIEYAQWAIQYALFNAQEAMIDVLNAFPSRIIGRAMKVMLFPWGRPFKKPDFAQDHQVASSMMKNSNYRDMLKKSCFIDDEPVDGASKCEYAFQAALVAADVVKTIRGLAKSGKIDKEATWSEQCDHAARLEIITQEEAELAKAAHEAEWEALQVDSYPKKSFKKR